MISTPWLAAPAGSTWHPGWNAGYRAGSDWARTHAPRDLVGGFPANENVQQTGFPSDDYARGYAVGVWATWCLLHGDGHRDCLATHACRKAVRNRARAGDA